MTALEFLSTTRYVYTQLKKYHIKTTDFNYIDMVKDYNRMVAEGRPPSRVKSLMQRRYNLSASTVNGAIKRLNRELDTGI